MRNEAGGISARCGACDRSMQTQAEVPAGGANNSSGAGLFFFTLSAKLTLQNTDGVFLYLAVFNRHYVNTWV
jgi:hypothetical protein